MSATNTSEAINNIKAPYTNKEGKCFQSGLETFFDLICFNGILFWILFSFGWKQSDGVAYCYRHNRGSSGANQPGKD